MVNKAYMPLDDSYVESIVREFFKLLYTENVVNEFICHTECIFKNVAYSETLRALCRRLSKCEGVFSGKLEVVAPALYLANVLQDKFLLAYRKITGHYITNYYIVESMYNLALQFLSNDIVMSYASKLLDYKGKGAPEIRAEKLPWVLAVSFLGYSHRVEQNLFGHTNFMQLIKESISELICMDMYDYTSPRVDLCLPNGEVIWLQNKLYNSSSELAGITRFAVEHPYKFYLDWEQILKSAVEFKEDVDFSTVV